MRVMMNTKLKAIVFAFALLGAGSVGPAGATGEVYLAQAQSGGSQLSDEQVRRILIERSIASYSGSCPCPYNRARNGSRCGKRSAYSRPGGASPLCYPQDISEDMVQRFRSR